MFKTEEEKVKYLLNNIEPVYRIYSGEKIYRAAAKLVDGTILPCVEFKSYTAKIEDIVDCFSSYNDEITNKENLDLINALFIYNNCISPHSIKEIIDSPYVIPKQFRNKLLEFASVFNIDLVHSGFYFITEMEDGTKFIHCYVEDLEFIDLPSGYSSKQIINVIPKTKIKDKIKLLGNKIPFDCYLKGL